MILLDASIHLNTVFISHNLKFTIHVHVVWNVHTEAMTYGWYLLCIAIDYIIFISVYKIHEVKTYKAQNLFA